MQKLMGRVIRAGMILLQIQKIFISSNFSFDITFKLIVENVRMEMTQI